MSCPKGKSNYTKTSQDFKVEHSNSKLRAEIFNVLVGVLVRCLGMAAGQLELLLMGRWMVPKKG